MKLSIIIPTLNEEKVLERTLKSLRQLSIVQYEIIVSDGHSTDRTLEIVHKYADKVVEHDGSFRQTIAQGRNAGAAAAKGEYFLFIDADVLIPDIDSFFRRALPLFETDPTLAGLTVFLQVLPEHVTLSDKLFFAISNRVNQVLNNVLHLGSASGEFMMMPAEKFRQVGGFNPQLVVAEDNDLFGRLSKVGKTRVETGLYVMHTSRRAHSVGWPILLALWLGNFIYSKLRGKSLSREWKAIR